MWVFFCWGASSPTTQPPLPIFFFLKKNSFFFQNTYLILPEIWWSFGGILTTHHNSTKNHQISVKMKWAFSLIPPPFFWTWGAAGEEAFLVFLTKKFICRFYLRDRCIMYVLLKWYLRKREKSVKEKKKKEKEKKKQQCLPETF